MPVKHQQTALGDTVPEKQFVDKLLNIDRELSYQRPMLVRNPIDDIVAGLTDGYSYHYQDRKHQHGHSNAGRGRFQLRNPRGQRAPRLQRTHRRWPRGQLGQGERNAGATTAIKQDICGRTATNYTQNSVSGSNSKLHEAVAVDVAAAEARGAEGQRLSDVDICTPIRSNPLDELGRDVVKMCVGHYVDHNRLSHPIDLEIEDVYWVPQCPMNVQAKPCISEQNICLYTGPRGNKLYIPGFADQTLGRLDKCTQEMDHDGNPVNVFNLGKGRPIMSTHPVDDGRVWSHMSDVLHNNDAACEIAAVQNAGMEYGITAFMAHLAYGHCGNAAMQLIAQAPELYGDVLAIDHVKGMRGQCKGCHLAGQVKRDRGLRQGEQVGRATMPGETLHADVACPIVPMSIGKAKYILVVVDELTHYSWVFPMCKKAQSARLLAILVQRINTQIRRTGEPGVRRLHTDQGGELKSTSMEEFCQWKGIIHTFTDRAQHQSNGLVERKIGQLNEPTSAALLASDPPAYLWPELYMAMCHTQNIVPSSALQRELKNVKKEQLEKAKKKDGEEGSTPGEQGDAVAQAAADLLEVPVRDMIP